MFLNQITFNTHTECQEIMGQEKANGTQIN